MCYVPCDEPGPNPPWCRCPESADHSEAVVFKDGRSFYLYVCEEHWSGRELRPLVSTGKDNQTP